MIPDKNQSHIVLYQTEDARTKLEVQLEGETVWLTQQQMADLFEKGRSTIAEHILNAFKEGELAEASVCREFRQTAADGKDYAVKFYNLDVIISVGYRVKSLRGAQFRIWATQRLREYIVKGFALDDERMKQGGERARYFQELLQRVRDIRATLVKYRDGIFLITSSHVVTDPRRGIPSRGNRSTPTGGRAPLLRATSDQN